MIRYVFSYQFRREGFFNPPIVRPTPPEIFVGDLKRSISVNKDIDQVQQFEGLDLYLIGYFDDVSGTFKNEKKFLLNMDEIISVVLKRLELTKTLEAAENVIKGQETGSGSNSEESGTATAVKA